MALVVVPLTLREARAFIAQHHRHHKPPQGMKFAIGVENGEGELVGVATAGRPVARSYGRLVIEVNRSCTDGTKNANSMLYGAVRRTAVAMGYQKVITYIHADESGATMRAAGFRLEAELRPRKSWAESSTGTLRKMRDPVGSGGVARQRWVWP